MGITKEEAIMALVRTVRACWNAVPINGWQQELLNDQIKRIIDYNREQLEVTDDEV